MFALPVRISPTISVSKCMSAVYSLLLQLCRNFLRIKISASPNLWSPVLCLPGSPILNVTAAERRAHQVWLMPWCGMPGVQRELLVQ